MNINAVQTLEGLEMKLKSLKNLVEAANHCRHYEVEEQWMLLKLLDKELFELREWLEQRSVYDLL